MLAHFEIVYMYLKKNRILFQGKERPAKKKMVQAKLRAVLACAESTPRSVSQLWISANVSRNQHVGPSFSEILIF